MRLKFIKRLLIAVRFRQSQARPAFGCPPNVGRAQPYWRNTGARHTLTLNEVPLPSCGHGRGNDHDGRFADVLRL